MASTYSELKFELIGTGDQSGTWGTTTNSNIGTAIQEAITGSADVTFSSADVTVTLTDTVAAQTARNLRLNLTGTTGGARNLILGSGCQIEKLYLINNGTADTVTVKNTTGTGIAVPAGKAMFVYNNATNVVDATTHLSSLTLGTDLAVADGGTGLSSGTSGGVLAFTATGTLASSAALTANALVLGGGAGAAPSPMASLGTTTTVLHGNASGAPTFAAVSLTADVTGTLPIANGGTGSTSTTFVNLATNVTGTLPIANGGTGSTSTTFVNLATNVTGTLPIANGGTGSTSTTFVNLATNVTGQLPLANGGTGANLTDPNADRILFWDDSATSVAFLEAGSGLSISGTTLTATASFATPLTVVGNATAGSEIRLPEDTDNGSNYVALKAPNTLASNLTFTLPSADGTSGQFLKTDGAGILSFGAAASTALTNNTRQAVTSSATTTLDLNSGNVIDLTMAADITTLSFTNVPASGTPILVQIVVINAAGGTAYTITWPNSVYWNAVSFVATQTAPDLATGANGVTVIALLTTDGGTKWRGWVESSIPGGTSNFLYLWGTNQSGQLGQNNTTNQSSPVQVGALTDWASVSAGASFCAAIKTDGTLWSWGNNSFGQLGQNNTTYRSSPVQIGALTDWASVSAGNVMCAAVKTNGTLWSWGGNGQGQLGQNNTTNQSSPVQVGALTNWTSVSAGGSHCAAIKTDGTLWSWGYNRFSQLGQNDTTYRSSPVQIGALTDWASVSAGASFCAAVKTNGTLWSWGNNSSAQLGQNDQANRSSPVQVGALTDWASTSAGNIFCVAVKTNGTLWSWGGNGQGQLGQNNTTNQSSPVQVGALTDWANVASSQFSYNCAAVKTNGTLWSWGLNSFGQLGQNDQANRSSPVQVGALTNWASVSAGNNFSGARRVITKNPA